MTLPLRGAQPSAAPASGVGASPLYYATTMPLVAGNQVWLGLGLGLG